MHFEKNDHLDNLIIFEVTSSKDCGYLNDR